MTGKGFMPAVRATTWLRGSRRLQKERTYGRGLADFTIDLLDGKLIDGETVYPAKEPAGEPTVIRSQQTPPPRLRLEASQWLADRGWGKPIQEVAVTPSRAFVVLPSAL